MTRTDRLALLTTVDQQKDKRRKRIARKRIEKVRRLSR